MARLPVVNQPAHRPGTLLDHLARRMGVFAEAVLASLGLRRDAPKDDFAALPNQASEMPTLTGPKLVTGTWSG